MITNHEWIESQQEKEQINENYNNLEKIKSESIEKIDENFELVVDRLFMAMGNFEKIEAYMTLDGDMNPRNFAPGNSNQSKGRDGLVSYPDFELVLEATRRPLAHTSHWDHLDMESKNKQLGIIVFLDISKVDPNLWSKNKRKQNKGKPYFHLCDADFLFKLLKDQPNAFSKFKEFLADSERIWRDETDYKIIEKKIITLIRQE
jgi:hypothetical protein